MTMPRTASPKTRMLSFQQLDSIMARRAEDWTLADPGGAAFMARRRRRRARLYGNYYVTYCNGSSSFSIQHFSTRGTGRWWCSVEVAAGPDGSSLYILPYTGTGHALRPSGSRSRKRWLEDKYRWTPYQWGDRLTDFWQAAYIVTKDGESEQIPLPRIRHLTHAVTPPSMRLSHAEWMPQFPARLRNRRSFSSAARNFTSALVRALEETSLPFAVDRSHDGPAELIVSVPPTMQRLQSLVRLRMSDIDTDTRKKLGVSVEWAAKHYCVRAVFNFSSLGSDGGLCRCDIWPSPAHAVRGVTQWFLEQAFHIPGPTLC